MKTYIALFRGINVGGKNQLPMKRLTQFFKEAGTEDIRTYINSGNVVFTIDEGKCPRIPARVGSKIKEIFGFEPAIHILELKEIENAIEGNPFPEAESKPESLHVGFLAAKPKNPDFKKLEFLKKDNERFKVVDRIFYLHAPDGVGRSKLAANSEKILGVSMTDRNWRTVCTIREIAYKIS